ncbi:MAG: thioesterase family protein [Thermoanaerobaculia bacterium]
MAPDPRAATSSNASERSEARPAFARPGWRDGWYVVPWEVTWRDVDAMGHVNNAVYFTYFEWARTKYWMALEGIGDPHDIGFIVAHAACDFRAELSLLERIEIRVRIGSIGTSSLEFQSEIASETGGKIAATGRVVVVLFDWASRAKIPVSEELRGRIERFQSA